ncbi:antitoxin MazE family protein [Limnobacter sp.]|uniref:antitoxin MazE family protein n=1 Tax=Limnobacter sp. TaxID=2003368 RepID=UPI003918AC2E
MQYKGRKSKAFNPPHPDYVASPGIAAAPVGHHHGQAGHSACGAMTILARLHAMLLSRKLLHVTVKGSLVANSNINLRVQKHRNSLRSAGLRPVQIWVPDTRKPGFSEECARQSSVVAQSDSADQAMNDLLNESLRDIEGWTD